MQITPRAVSTEGKLKYDNEKMFRKQTDRHTHTHTHTHEVTTNIHILEMFACSVQIPDPPTFGK